MPDNLILIGLILILVHEILNTGKSDLIDVLINLLLRHTKAVIGNSNGLVSGVHRHLNLVFHILRFLILPHQLKLFKLGNCIAAIAD